VRGPRAVIVLRLGAAARPDLGQSDAKERTGVGSEHPALAMTTPAIEDLGFLSGRWQGDNFLMEFGTPHGTMIFGSMQAVEGGVTTYWETFRIAREGDALACYPAQMGSPSGRYEIAALSRENGSSAVFENGANPLHRRIEYAADAAGQVLTISVDGEREGKPYRQSWQLRRA
jgi:hypothetical protein